MNEYEYDNIHRDVFLLYVHVYAVHVHIISKIVQYVICKLLLFSLFSVIYTKICINL